MGDLSPGRLTESVPTDLPEQFYERLENLIEAAQSLTRAHHAHVDEDHDLVTPRGFVPEGERREGPADRRVTSDLGNLETLRSGVSHAALVRRRIAARRARDAMFPPGLFADPAWDMLLDLYGAHIAQHRVPLSALCIAAAVPATTALRWIGKLEREGMVARRSDPNDGRRVFVELTEPAVVALQQFFDQMGSDAIGAA